MPISIQQKLRGRIITNPSPLKVHESESQGHESLTSGLESSQHWLLAENHSRHRKTKSTGNRKTFVPPKQTVPLLIPVHS